MIPECIANRDVNSLRSIVLAKQVRSAIRDLRARLFYDEQPPDLVYFLEGGLPDNDDEHEAIIKSLPHLTDEQVGWLMDNVQPSYMRFRVVEELMENRPHCRP